MHTTTKPLGEEALLSELEELLRSMPAREGMYFDDDDTLSWYGHARAIAQHLDPTTSIPLTSALDGVHMGMSDVWTAGHIRMLLLSARHSLRMRITGPVSMAIGQGRVFEYFDSLRKVLTEARFDAFFIDAYMDADFVSRYMPLVFPSVKVRLLTTTKSAKEIMPAIRLFSDENSIDIEIRSCNSLHDRYLIVDKERCFQSGASFKDGGRKATTLTQIIDAFDPVRETYETMWEAADPRLL